MTTDNYLALARDREQQKFWKILAGAVGGSLLLHAIAAVIFNSLPQPASDNAVEVTLFDSSELSPDFPPSPTPSVKMAIASTPSPSPKVTPTPTPTPSVKITPTPTPTPSAKVKPTPTPSVKFTPTPTPTPSVRVTPTPTLTPSVKVTPTPTPTPSVKVTPKPLPVKIVTQRSKPQPLPTQQPTEPIIKPSGTASPTIIATNPSPAAQPNKNKIEQSNPAPQTTVDDQTARIAKQPNSPVIEKPLTPSSPSAIDSNNSPNSSSSVNSGQQSQLGLTNPTLSGSFFDPSGLGDRSGDPPTAETLIFEEPGGSLIPNGRNNSNNKLPNGAASENSSLSSSGNARESPGDTSSKNPSGESGSPSRPGKGNGNSSGGSGTSKGKPGITSPSLPTNPGGNGSGGTDKQEIQKYFGELACVKNCKPNYPGVITDFKQVRVNIKLNNQGRVVQSSIEESCDNPKFDNYAVAKFKEMLFQLPTGSQRDFIVTMEFKSR
jgi:TonB family protein